MDGVMGLASWRWLFIFDFILGIPVAIFGVFVCPDEPKGVKIWWMSDAEKALSIKRMARDGRDAVGAWTWDVVGQILRAWQFYAFVIGWGLVELTCGNNLSRWMGLWLKELGYGSSEYNTLPTVVYVVELGFIFISAVVADSLNNRSLPILCLAAFQLFGYIVLLIGTNNFSLRMAAYYIAGAYGGLSPLLGGWINCSCGGDKQLRSFTTAMMISVGYAIEAPAQQRMFPVSEAPDFRHSHGYAYGVGMVVAMAVWCSAVIPLLSRYWCFNEKTACSEWECENPGAADTTDRSNKATDSAD
ncbi:hypothetical protein PWT90_04929 [Aphanocladium album]|nr:hypothetical protein PWT90_04929 [Aphanocladium album]